MLRTDHVLSALGKPQNPGVSDQDTEAQILAEALLIIARLPQQIKNAKENGQQACIIMQLAIGETYLDELTCVPAKVVEILKGLNSSYAQSIKTSPARSSYFLIIEL